MEVGSLTREKSKSPFRIWFKRSLLVLLAVYGVWRFVLPVFDTHPEQDQCTFGPVSNARYQELLAEARRSMREEWVNYPSNREEQADEFSRRIQDLNKGEVAIYSRIAGMHAVMRAAGASLKKPTKFSEGFWNQSQFRIGKIMGFPGSSYYINSIRLGSFDPIQKYSEISVGFKSTAGNVAGFSRSGMKRKPQIDEFYTRVRHPSSMGDWLRLGSGPVFYDPEKFIYPCPDVPTRAWSDSYMNWRKRHNLDDAEQSDE